MLLNIDGYQYDGISSAWLYLQVDSNLRENAKFEWWKRKAVLQLQTLDPKS